jgi:nicotinamidase-related amidase
MPGQNTTLLGNAPDQAHVALLLIDVINDMEFPEGDQLLRHFLPMARNLRALKVRAKKCGIPAIYVNDNFGRWRSDFNTQVNHCLHDDVRGRPVVELLAPATEDYFVLKPKHSGFYCTVLDILLDHLGVGTVVLGGVAGNICVLFTAQDAYLRDLQLYVPSDCVASNTAGENQSALKQMERVLKADTRSSDKIDLEQFAKPQHSKRAS